ncbi:MAG: FAD-dependent oxidoreductase [Ignisphaera sp.]
MRFAFLCREGGGKRGSVAVVGAGPAGLAAAGYLACEGFEVDVYDKLPYAGGMMMFAIPSYRIYPDNIIEGVEDLRDRMSVKFYFNTKVFAKGQKRHDEGDEFVKNVVELEDIVEKYKAVLIATGTWSSRKLDVEGEDSKNVFSALEYLYHWRIYEEGLVSEKPPKGNRIVVIGAGLSAVDAAEKALETGAEVFMVYRRTIFEAPAGVYTINSLIREGVKWMELLQPTKIISKNGFATGVEFVKMRLGEPDETGRPRPIPIPGSEFVIEVDLVILAVGEIPTPPFMGQYTSVSSDKSGRIIVNRYHQTSKANVFAAGDVVTGPTFIGKAFSGGLRAGKSISSYLSYGKL